MTIPMMTLGQAQQLQQNQGLVARVVGDSAVQIHRVHTDTRTLQIGDLFVALKGERYDAHAFLPQAHEAGAVAVIARTGTIPAGLSGIEVQDTLQALQALARAWRQRMAPSLALIRARRRLGMAIAAKSPMIATTIMISTSVKPFLFNLINMLFLLFLCLPLPTSSLNYPR